MIWGKPMTGQEREITDEAMEKYIRSRSRGVINQPKHWTYAMVTLATVAMLAYTWIGVERERRMMDDLRRLEYRAAWIETQLMQRHQEYEGFLHHLGYTCRGEYVMDSLIRRRP